MNEYFTGLVSGFVTAFLVVVGLIWYFFLHTGHLSAPSPRMHIPLRGKSKPLKDPLHETLGWLNTILSRLIADSNSSQITNELMRSRLEQLINSRLPGDFVEPVIIISIGIECCPEFKEISSTHNTVELSMEWTAENDNCLSMEFHSAVGFKGLVVLPFEAQLCINRVKAKLQVILHTHYLELALVDDFVLDIGLQSRIGHQVKLKDCAALNEYIKALISTVIKERLVDRSLIIPYATFATFIPRAMSPPISPIPSSLLFVSTDSLATDDFAVPGSLKQAS